MSLPIHKKRGILKSIWRPGCGGAGIWENRDYYWPRLGCNKCRLPTIYTICLHKATCCL